LGDDGRVVREVPNGVILDIRVVPRAGKTAIAGARDEALLVRVAAAPIEGAANAAVVDFLSRLLDVPKRDVLIVAGGKSRTKRVKVVGLSAIVVRQRLGLA
jgi:uncharacterized protein (TIGR00251 family)